MRVGIISAHIDHRRRGSHHRGILQPQAGALIAALLPAHVDVELINDAWRDPDYGRDYDLLIVSCLHSDFDRARQLSHYWRRRGATTVLGGSFASTFPQLAAPWFDAVVIGDPESTIPHLFDDFSRKRLEPLYRSGDYLPEAVPTPRFDLMLEQSWLPLSLEITRGCPFTCDFCALTGVGTRHHVRPVADVVRDLEAARRVAGEAGVGWLRRRIAGFYDNNLGGNLGYLRTLCRALEPLRLRWGVCVTFNVLCDPDLLAAMARAGCRGVFVGLESFNPAALSDMGKFQNVLAKTRAAIGNAHREGILVMAGLMLSPDMDDAAYMADIPAHLDRAGLHVPTYVSFEIPIPGTPHFQKLAQRAQPPLLPDAPLYDFNGYNLVTRPRHMPAEDFAAAYRGLQRRLFHPGRRLAKLARDTARLLPSGRTGGILFDAFELATESGQREARSHLAGRDRVPPELHSIPFTANDFRDETEYNAIMLPWRVADGEGRILHHWTRATPVWGRRGRVLVPPHPEPGVTAPPDIVPALT
jgi:hypothetical protein